MILDSITELKASKLVETPDGGEEHLLCSTEYGDVMSKVGDVTPSLGHGYSHPHSSTSSRIRLVKFFTLLEGQLILQR